MMEHGAVRAAGLVLAVCCGALRAQGAAAKPPGDWAKAASRCQVAILQEDRGFSVEFRQSKHDAKGEATRIVIDSSDGSVARLVERDGHPLTPEQDAAERSRLNEVLASPGEFAAHHKRDANDSDYAISLLKLMPAAMTWRYAGEQQKDAEEVHLVFEPDPTFRPPSIVANVLTGLAGEATVDPASGCMTHIEGHVIKPVNFGFGVLARIAPGGAVALDQRQVVPERWLYTQLREHLKVRALLLKVLPEDTEIDVSEVRPLPHPIAYQEAIRTLLAIPVTTR